MTNTTNNTAALNETAVEMVAAFSKANKVSKVKVTDLLQQVLATIPAQTVEVEKVVPMFVVTSKKTSSAIIALRETMFENLSSVKQATVKELSSRFGAEPSEVTRTLAFFENNGFIVRDGLKAREGVRGRREVLWSAAENV